MMRTAAPGAFRRWTRALLAAILASTGVLVASSSAARASTFVGYVTELTDIPEGTPIHVPDAWQTLVDAVYHTGKCATVPGVTRAGEVWNELYKPLSGRVYNSLKFFLYTQYSPGVATAIETYHSVGPYVPRCDQLYQYQNMTEAQAFNAVACDNVTLFRSSQYCVQYHRHADDPMVNGFGMDLGRCRQPRFNDGTAQGPKGWAEWHDVGGTYISTVDLVDEINQKIGFHVVPGDFTVPVLARDFTMLGGVFNVDRHTLQPANDEPEWRGFGNVPTSTQALYTNYYGFAYMASVLGLPFVPGHDNYATDLVIGDQINKALKSGGTPIDDFVLSGMNAACHATGRVADVLEGPWNSTPDFDLVCGIRSRHFWSDMANGESILDFLKSQNVHYPKALHDNPFFPSVIAQEAFSNTGNVVVGNPKDGCKTLFELKAKLPGSNHDARYNHFVQLVQNLAKLLGG